jgi:hypothetical protein
MRMVPNMRSDDSMSLQDATIVSFISHIFVLATITLFRLVPPVYMIASYNHFKTFTLR